MFHVSRRAILQVMAVDMELRERGARNQGPSWFWQEAGEGAGPAGRHGGVLEILSSLQKLPVFPGGLPRALSVSLTDTPQVPMAGWTPLHGGLPPKPRTVPGTWLVPDQYLLSE